MRAAKPIRRNGTLHIKRRVPARYKSVEEREFVWISLHTDSEEVAAAKVPVIWRDMIEAWEARLVGSDTEAAGRMEAAKNLAAKRGFAFMPAVEVARLPLEELLTRLEATLNRKGEIDLIEAEAILGGAQPPGIRLSGVLDHYWSVAKDKTLNKSADQLRRWRNPRIKAVQAFTEATGNKAVADITTADVQAFRSQLVERMLGGDIEPSSVNKDLIHLLSVLKTVASANDIVLRFRQTGWAVKAGKKNTRPPLPADWIRDKILVSDALSGLNGEARAILLGMVNTGYRPSEGAMLRRAQIRLDTDIPHISIEPVTRHLKTDHSERIIPLAGISLVAFQQFPDGFPRYSDSASLTATVNKFLRENELLPSDAHSMYSLRHGFEDRLLAAGVDERIRSDLMGHTIKRQRYGAGADLVMLLRVIQSIAL